MPTLKFPQNFYWGAATSAHQVEGGNKNNWSEWEKRNAERLAREAEAKFAHLKNWPAISSQARNPANYISGSACDHYNLFEKDFDIAQQLGHNAHRLSLEWSRIEPAEGKFDEKEIEHYRQVILALRKRGMEPFVTLWHWTDPVWIRDIGGWKSKRIANYFSRYTEKVVSKLGNEVKFWITLNEPEIFSGQSYLKGEWPPQRKGALAYLRVWHNLIKTHRAAYLVIKKINPESQVGIAKNNIFFEAYKNRPCNVLLKKLADWWWNFYFLNRIKNHQDFIGLNHYFHNRVNYGFNKNENRSVSDLGWKLYPEALYAVLMDLKKYQKPIYITENGLADAKDEKREWFLQEYLKNVLRAISDGTDVRGYFYWSLLDNFEWDKGFWPRFGLVEVDFATQERKIRPSAYEYAKIAKTNSLEFPNQ